MLIEGLYNRKEISVRVYNICRRSGISSMDDLQIYFDKYKSFINLPNCGIQSNDILIDLCKKYIEDKLENKDIIEKDDSNNECEELNVEYVKNSNPISDLISNLSNLQKDVLNSIVLNNIKCLTVRSRNSLSNYLNNEYDIENLAKKTYLYDSFSIDQMKNIGNKSIIELEVFFSIIEDYIHKVSKTNDERRLLFFRNKLLFGNAFPGIVFPNEIIGTDSIFLFVDYLLKYDVLFPNKRDASIVKQGFSIYNDNISLTLDEIASSINISRERVRQIRLEYLTVFFDQLSIIKNINDNLQEKYNIEAL